MTETSLEDIRMLSLEEQAFVESLEAGQTCDTVTRLLVSSRAREDRAKAEMAALNNEIASLKANATPASTFVRPASAGAVGRLPNEIVHRVFMLLVHARVDPQDLHREHLDAWEGFAMNAVLYLPKRLGMFAFAAVCHQWREVVQVYRDKCLVLSALHADREVLGARGRSLQHLCVHGTFNRALSDQEISSLLHTLSGFLPSIAAPVPHLALRGGCASLLPRVVSLLPGACSQLKGVTLLYPHGSTVPIDCTVATTLAHCTTLRSLRIACHNLADEEQFAMRALLAAAALPELVYLSIKSAGSLLPGGGPLPNSLEVISIPPFASTSLQYLELDSLVTLNLDAALQIASSSAATLESLSLRQVDGIGATPSLTPPPLQYTKLTALTIAMSALEADVGRPWTHIPRFAEVLEGSPALEMIQMDCNRFTNRAGITPSPMRRFKGKISNGVVKIVRLKVLRSGRAQEFERFMAERDWPAGVDVSAVS